MNDPLPSGFQGEPTMDAPTAPPKQPAKRKGFSLVEITLALAIFAFAIVTILGLLPLGLDTFRTSVDSNVEAGIVQEILREAQQTPFYQGTDDLLASTYDGKTYYYDNEGTVLTTGTDRAVYTVTVNVLGGSLEGQQVTRDVDGQTRQLLRRLKIKVVSRMRGNDKPNTYTANLADLGITR